VTPKEITFIGIYYPPSSVMFFALLALGLTSTSHARTQTTFQQQATEASFIMRRESNGKTRVTSAAAQYRHSAGPNNDEKPQKDNHHRHTPAHGRNHSSTKQIGNNPKQWGYWQPSEVVKLIAQWPQQKRDKLKRMASNTMWEVLKYSAIPQDAKGSHYFVQAGDLPQMWLRDSTASTHHLLTTGAVDRFPYVRRVLDGLGRTLARYLKKDKKCSAWEPYDNGRECRGGGSYTDMRFELDSPMYVLRLMRLLKAHGSQVLDEDEMQAAAHKIVELAGELQENAGFLSTETRPSDDNAQGYNIPDNFFAAVELSRLGDIVKDQKVVEDGKALSKAILTAIERHGHKKDDTYGDVFCYEVTTSSYPLKGQCLLMDDANVPSLLSLPYLDDGAGLLDEALYENTRKMVLSQADPYFYTSADGSINGIGSPHVPGRKVWPMAMITRALTAKDASEVATMLDMIVRTDSGKELIHESVLVDDPSSFTRVWFDWPNSLFAELVDKCCSDLAGTRTEQPPAHVFDNFDGWETCGFRDGACRLDGTKFVNEKTLGKSKSMSTSLEEHLALADGAAQVCTRYGTPFHGFDYRLFSTKDFPIQCKRSSFGVTRSGAFHCAVAEPEFCKSPSMQSIGGSADMSSD
jgi:hypothetical protein